MSNAIWKLERTLENTWLGYPVNYEKWYNYSKSLVEDRFESSRFVESRLLQLPRVHQFVDVLIRGQHRLILPEALILPRDRAIGIGGLALDAILAVLGSLHVTEEPEHVRVVAARPPQLVQFPGQLGRDEVRVGRVSGRASIHGAHGVLPATFARVTEPREHRVQPWQQGRVERIVVGQQQRARWNLVEHLKEFVLNNFEFLRYDLFQF